MTLTPGTRVLILKSGIADASGQEGAIEAQYGDSLYVPSEPVLISKATGEGVI